ncbi:hypothetical protein MLD38_040082 [Melastoma candidum]|uniref:Uncharacterized protein n=1 Tax=Melastoma candidum TaxID=119954 RepID=A0ACB9L5E2_9MYRT|nr:hypothetical protein MLD38_040082 [Melastoma candidum]
MSPPSGSAARWLCLVAVIWLQSFSGTNSNFPAYSSQLKRSLSLSQLQLNNLAFASDSGKLLGWFSGLAAAHLPLWVVLFIGTSLGSLGYGIQYLFVANRISSLSYVQVFLLTILGGNSICWINTVCYVATIRYFPLQQQVAVGLTTSYQGLSASIYADMVRTAFNIKGVNVPSSPSTTNSDNSASAYLLLNSLIPPVVSVIAAPLLRINNASDDVKTSNGGVGFIVLFIITVATGIYAVMNSLETVSRRFSPLAGALGMGAFLLVPTVIPLVVSIRASTVVSQWMSSRQQRVHDDIGEITDKVVVVVDIPGDGDVPVEPGEKWEKRALEDVGPWKMLRKVDFWLYFFVYLLGATLGLVFLNNLGQIAESRGCSGTSSLVALSSAFGFLGRLLPSLLDYISSRRKYTVARPAIMGVLMVPMTAAFFMLLNPSARYLFASTALIGICTGAISCTAVSTTAELFGPKNFGINHNIVVANIPIGSLVFGYLAALLYRRHAQETGTCMGSDCFQTTFIIWGCLCTCGTFLALIFYMRTRDFYSKLSTPT